MRYFILLLMITCSAFAFLDFNSHNKTYYDETDINVDQRSEERKEADLLDDRIEHYEERFSTDRSTALALIDLSVHKKKSILRVYEDYYKEKCGTNILTYAEMDYKTTSMLKEIGFKQKGTNWFFEGEKVNVGKMHSGKFNKKDIPDDLYFKASAKITDSNSILITIKTNLPDNNPLMVNVNNENDSTTTYTIDSVYARNGVMEVEITSPKISKGRYVIDIYDKFGAGILFSKTFSPRFACGRFTRGNPMFDDRVSIHAKKNECSECKKRHSVRGNQHRIHSKKRKRKTSSQL